MLVSDRCSALTATTLSRGEIAYQMDTTPVKTCMTREVITIAPDTDMVHAARLLLERRFGCLPVVEARRLIGVVTELDCLRAILAAKREGAIQRSEAWLEERYHARHNASASISEMDLPVPARVCGAASLARRCATI